MRHFVFLSILVIAFLLCYPQTQKKLYNESTEDFANPERGFYIPLDVHASKFVPLNAEKMIRDRKELQKHGSASYSIYATLLYRGYVLDTFVDKPLSESFLSAVDNDLAMVRQAGIKMIIRFAYTNKVHKGDCPDKAICPPYGDATKEVMLNHIAQLKPILQKNADVIAVMQQGFIGIWGENYYTDHFGDASDNGNGKILDENWNDRNAIIKALLAALPKDRMVQVRTPQMKQKFVYGASAIANSNAINEQQAFDFSDNARIGFHNDCFLASADDYGTFFDYGSSFNPKAAANEAMRSYFEKDSRYGPVGGETCDDTFSPQNDCAPAGHAEQEMEAMHYSYLNTAYNNRVNNDWDSMGCMNSIKRRLGYRFVVKEASFPTKTKAGTEFTFAINLTNKGFASPYNPRPVHLILRNVETKKEFSIDCKADIRYWFSGEIHWKETLKVPTEIPAGKYELLLNLPDKYPALSKRPEYSIRIANENTWEQSTGFNKLNTFIAVVH